MFKRNKTVSGQEVNSAVKTIVATCPYIGAVISGSDPTVQQSIAQLVMSAFDKDVPQEQLAQMARDYLDQFRPVRAVHKYIILQVAVSLLEVNLFQSDAPLERLTKALY